MFRSLVGGPDHGDKIRFVIYQPYYQLPNGVRIYHGNQFEALNQVSLRQLFITEGYREPILNLPWGSIFLLKVLLPFKEKRPYITLVQPFSRYLRLALFMDTRFALPLTVKGLYYFMKTRFIENRKRADNFLNTLKIVKEEAVFTRDLAEVAGELFKDNPALNVIIMGHNHTAKVRRYPGDRLYINTGTWTKLINLAFPDLGVHDRLTYALVEYRKGESSPRAGLNRWYGRQELSEEVKY
jgi:UDP-2,3-diacylglucosamine pyrophosphatase LpxH